MTEQTNIQMGKSLFYEYDANGNLTRLENSEDRVVSYEYDIRNLMTAVIDPDGNRGTFEYNPLGIETKRKLANGNETINTYDKDNQLLKVDNRNASGSTISSYEYQYDAAGNRLGEKEADETLIQYRYDDLDRLNDVLYSTSDGLKDTSEMSTHNLNAAKR